MDLSDLIELLKEVPPMKPLAIYGFTWKMVTPSGKLDRAKVLSEMPDLREAAQEAEVYVHEVAELTRRLLECSRHQA